MWPFKPDSSHLQKTSFVSERFHDLNFPDIAQIGLSCEFYIYKILFIELDLNAYEILL